MGDPKLTEKQRKFVEAYMGRANGNATEAARVAGYAGNDVTLASVGSENLKKPQIRAAIDQRAETDPLVMSREERLETLSAMARGEVPDVYMTRHGPKEGAAGLTARQKAIDLLNKMTAQYVERHEVSGPGQAPIIELFEDK